MNILNMSDKEFDRIIAVILLVANISSFSFGKLVKLYQVENEVLSLFVTILTSLIIIIPRKKINQINSVEFKDFRLHTYLILVIVLNSISSGVTGFIDSHSLNGIIRGILGVAKFLLYHYIIGFIIIVCILCLLGAFKIINPIRVIKQQIKTILKRSLLMPMLITPIGTIHWLLFNILHYTNEKTGIIFYFFLFGITGIYSAFLLVGIRDIVKNCSDDIYNMMYFLIFIACALIITSNIFGSLNESINSPILLLLLNYWILYYCIYEFTFNILLKLNFNYNSQKSFTKHE
jgi:hypothetical protein